ncbi:MAG: hypothetical protein OXD30_03075 [Bryobacterales bacterium]|nr:hypothetical protein [Bryobacterales bacterium]
MAAAIDENPGLQGQYGEMLTLAWRAGRANAVERLAEYSASRAEDDHPHEQAADARLPDDCPYLVEHVAAYDPKRDKQPRSDVWPPGVAVAFNSLLQTDYEIQQGPQNSPVGRAKRPADRSGRRAPSGTGQGRVRIRHILSALAG